MSYCYPPTRQRLAPEVLAAKLNQLFLEAKLGINQHTMLATKNIATKRHNSWASALDCAAARMPIDRAAGLLGIGPRTLWIFAKRVGLPVFAVWKGIPARVAGSRTAKMR
jgi:hypothetical protein